jgi:hypothetical protein
MRQANPGESLVMLVVNPEHVATRLLVDTSHVETVAQQKRALIRCVLVESGRYDLGDRRDAKLTESLRAGSPCLPPSQLLFQAEV